MDSVDIHDNTGLRDASASKKKEIFQPMNYGSCEIRTSQGIGGIKKIKFTERCMSGKARIVLVCPKGH